MLLFRSEEHIERWCEQRNLEHGGTMTPAQCWQLADAWFRDRMEPSYQRRTSEQARELFESIGLVGEFWRLG